MYFILSIFENTIKLFLVTYERDVHEKMTSSITRCLFKNNTGYLFIIKCQKLTRDINIITNLFYTIK